jgi:hypothetical protein
MGGKGRPARTVCFTIGDYWQVTADPYGYALEQRVVVQKTGEHKWLKASFHNTPQACLVALSRHKMRKISVSDPVLAEAIESLTKAYNELGNRLIEALEKVQ